LSIIETHISLLFFFIVQSLQITEIVLITSDIYLSDFMFPACFA